MPRPSFITLFLAIAVAQLLVATSPAANALQGVGLPAHVANRGEHVNVNRRMIKQRRAAADQDVPVNAAGDPSPSSTTPPASASTPANGNNNSRTTTTASSSQNGGILGDISSALVGSTSSSTTSSTSTTSTSSTPATTSTPQSTPQSTSTPVRSTTRAGGSVVVITASVTESASPSDAASNPNNSFLPKPVIIGLIVAGSCVVAAAAIWTVIRKWKFSPSRHFEDRLEPINWEPKAASGVDHDPTMAALGRSASRNGSNGGRDSFYSGDGHGSVRNMSNTHNDSVTMAPDFPPPHDFTAGAAGGLNAGYVDMHRGPSPAPTQYGAAGYGGQYETPNPYDAYDYNAGYGQQQRRY